VNKKEDGPLAKEIHILCCESCAGTSFLLAEDHTVYCAKCIERVAARWMSSTSSKSLDKIN
jgi:hypothetical protein